MLGWSGERGRRGKRVVAGLSMIASIVVAQGLQAAAVRMCPHHTGSVHVAGSSSHLVAAGDLTVGRDASGHGSSHDARSSHDGGSHDGRSSHEGPCDCLGPCSGTAAVDPPPAPSESSFAQMAPRRQVLRDPAAAGRTLRTVPFALPYPNAPPA